MLYASTGGHKAAQGPLNVRTMWSCYLLKYLDMIILFCVKYHYLHFDYVVYCQKGQYKLANETVFTIVQYADEKWLESYCLIKIMYCNCSYILFLLQIFIATCSLFQIPLNMFIVYVLVKEEVLDSGIERLCTVISSL